MDKNEQVKRIDPPPPEAFRFAAEVIPIRPAADGEKRRTFSGVAYAGKVVNHPWWGPVVFDLSTTTAAPKLPVLILHDRNQRAGFAGVAIEANQLVVRNGVLLANEHGRQVATESDEGFPWQLSVHIEHDRSEEIPVGGTAVVNGQTIPGPVQIWRDNTIREISFTPTGVDNETHALAASMGSRAAQSRQREEQDNMATVDDLQAQVGQFQAQVTGLNAQVAQLTAELCTAKQDVAGHKARADSAEAKLAEQAKAQRAGEVKTLFSEVGIPFSEVAATPYMSMDREVFTTVAIQLRALKAPPPGHLFSDQANAGRSANDEAATIERLSKL